MLSWYMSHKWNGQLFVMLRKSWEVYLYLMNKSNMTSISASTFEFEAIIQTQDMTTSGMICCSCPLRNMLKYSNLIWYT